MNTPNFDIELTFSDAIKYADLDTVKKCLSAGEIKLTSKSIHEFIYEHDYTRYHYYDRRQYENERELIFELLLKHAFTLIVTDMPAMEKILTNINYIELIIKYGYNDSYSGSIEVFKKIIGTWSSIYSDRHKFMIYSLLDNGFKKHIPVVLVHFIMYGHTNYLLDEKFDANFYSILYDVYQHILTEKNYRINRICYVASSNFRCANIHFFLDNVYKIKMLGQPIIKYFLIGLIQWDTFVVPKDIYVYIFRIYMETDHVMTDHMQKFLK